jgi:hypothetical protein
MEMRERRVCAYERCDELLPVDAPENQAFHHSRCRTAQWRLDRERPRRVKPSGRQVSYRKAVGLVAGALQVRAEYTPERAEEYAERLVQGILPDRQRPPTVLTGRAAERAEEILARRGL